MLSYSADCPTDTQSESQEDGMLAVRARCYGPPDILTLETVAIPEPNPDELLVRVEAAAVNPYDYHFMRGSPYLMRLGSGLVSPKDVRVGVDFSGVVVAVGGEVTDFAIDDAVFGSSTGAFAEYVTVREDGPVAKKPENVSLEAAATVGIAALTAIQALRDHGKVGPETSVLINGASGGVGTYAVQIARSFGATVTGVCSTRNVELVRSLGAETVIDYKAEDYTQLPERYDVIVDMVGNHSPSANHDLLNDGGRYVLVGGPKGNWIAPLKRPLQNLWTSLFVDEEMSTVLAKLTQKDMNAIADLMASQEVVPATGEEYALADVQDAIRYSESRRARGKIVLKVRQPD